MVVVVAVICLHFPNHPESPGAGIKQGHNHRPLHSCAVWTMGGPILDMQHLVNLLAKAIRIQLCFKTIFI